MMQQTTKALKIAFFLEGMYASGVDTSTRLLAHALRNLGHSVISFVPWEEHCHREGADETFLLPAARINPKQSVYLTYPLSLALMRKFKKEQFDLIHIHTSTSVNLLAWQAAKLFNLPIVYTYHTMSKEYLHYLGPLSTHMGGLLDSMVEGLDKLVCERADLVLTPSGKAARYLAEIGISTPVTVIPNGINLKEFCPAPSTYLQTRFGVPTQAKVLLFVGRLNQEKRPLLAYELFRKLCRQYDNLCLVMVGDGTYRHLLTQMAARDGLQNRLFLTGLIGYADMPAVYNSANLWISTSQSEVHPMAALEAVACGLPAVAFSDSALDGVIQDGVNGFLVDTNEDFIERLQRILQDQALYHAMRRAAALQIQPYSIESAALRLLLGYEHVVTSARSTTKVKKLHSYLLKEFLQ